MAIEKSNKSSSDEDILQVARDRFAQASEYEIEIREDARDDLKFSAGEQWDPHVVQQRRLENRPCLVINRLPQTIRQITNDQRQNRPAIKVSPVDDKADIETAKILQGMARHIEYASDADTAYDTAFDSAVRCGFGFFRIVTEYCDPESFDQEIRIKRVADRFAVFLDPSYQKPDGSDAGWGFVCEDISKSDFKAQYPDAEISQGDWELYTDIHGDWIKKDTVRVAEYFVKEFKNVTICKLGDGSVVEESQVVDGMVVVAKRQTLMPNIKWYKINGQQILDQTDWPGRWIPIIPVLGEELIIEGKRKLVSVVRYAKDPQRMYNYWKTSETETIALAPKAPWVADYKTIERFKNEWSTANTKNHSYLPYDSKDGRAAPSRQVFEPAVQAISQASMYAADDIKATTGVYDAALGNKSNENSGIAIQRRNVQSQTSNFHFMDNLSKAIRHAGRIIVDLIPHIYDTPRAVRILGEDGSEEIVRLNEMFDHKGQKDVIYNPGAGKYDVTVDTGPSFETKRQEAVQAMLDFTKAMPNQAANIADLLVKNMDWPQSQEIAERLKKLLPPGIADDPKDAQQPLPPQAQQQMQQMNQLIEQLTEQLKHKTEQINTKALELESRERIEMAKLNTQIEIAMASLGSKESMELLGHEIAGIKHRLELLNFNQPIENEFESGGGSGPDQAGQPMPMEQQQSTGGPQSPGNYMGEQP